MERDDAHYDNSSYAALGRRASSNAPVPNAFGSALTTVMDGGSDLAAATAIHHETGSVRSRSRSPHPAGSPSPRSGGAMPVQMRGDDLYNDRRYANGIRDSSIDLQSMVSTPSDGVSSSGDLSSIAVLDPLNEDKSGQMTAEPGGLRVRIAEKWEESKGLLMVVLAMFFSSMMGATARLLQTGPAPMNAFQILFARMSITSVLLMAYMRWKRIADAPLGARGVRKLLVARGVGGFFGVFGLYYSVGYLPLAESVVITFLAPMVANWLCSVLLKETFTRREQLAGVLSLIGVIFIARPFSFLTSHEPSSSSSDPNSSLPTAAAAAGGNSTTPATGNLVPAVPEATPMQRIIAVLVALVGVLGAASAYTMIRRIGRRTHPLISVNYFAVWCTIVSGTALAIAPAPGMTFRLPSTLREWLLLAGICAFGMAGQSLLTAGLGRQKGSAATNMMYTQMVFVLVVDYAVWGVVLTWASWVGCVLILGSQIWGAMARQRGQQQEDHDDSHARSAANANGDGSGGGHGGRDRQGRSPDRDEEAGLVSGVDRGDDDDDDDDHDTRQHEFDNRELGYREARDGLGPRIEMSQIRRTG